MAKGDLQIDILAKDKSSAAFKQVSSSADKAGRSLDAGAAKGGKFGKSLKVGAAAAAAALAAVGAAAFKLAQGAADDEKAAGILAKTLRNTAGATKAQVAATEDWITAQGKALGVADDDLRPALGLLATATHDVGKAQKLASLAMDVSAGTGKSLETVTMALAKAQNGSVGGLSRLGIATKDAAGKTLSFDVLQKRLAATFKGQAATAANTAAGKMQRAKVALSEAGEEIGYKLLPILTALASFISDKVVPVIGQFSDALTKKIIPAIKSAVDWVTKHKALVIAIAASIAALIVVVKLHDAAMAISAAGGMAAYILQMGVVQAAIRVWAAVQWILNAALSANPIALVVLAIAGLVAAIVVAWQKSETFRNIVTGAFNAIKSAAMAVWNWIKNNWKLLLGIITGPIGIAVGLVVGNWNRIKSGARNVVSAIGGFFSGVGNTILAPFNWVKDKITGVFSSIKSGALGAINGIVSSIGDIGKMVINAVIGVINKGIQKMNDLIPNKIGVGWASIDLPDNPFPSIPKFAKGTTFAPGGMSLVGEQGPELVNLPRGSQVIPNHKISDGFSRAQMRELAALIGASVKDALDSTAKGARTA